MWVLQAWLLVLLQTEPGSPLDIVSYGVTGVVLFLLITGWLWPKPAVDALLKRIKDLMDELAAQRIAHREEVAELLRRLREKDDDDPRR